MADQGNSPVSPSSPVARFSLGRLVATSNAVSQLSPEDVLSALRRHESEDRGEPDKHNWKVNENALTHGGRLVTVFQSAGGVKFYIITEWDRSVTTVLLPEDY